MHFKSINNTIWKINLEENFLNKIHEIQTKFNFSFLTSFILTTKNLTHEEINNLINFKFDLNSINLSSLNNFNYFEEILKTIIKEKNKITIISDYDADGICSAVIFSEFCNNFNIPFELIIPNRQQGYGITKEMISKIKTKFVFTLDCGSNQLNLIPNEITVIVIDHHRCKIENNKNKIVINPNNLLFFNEELSSLCATTLLCLLLKNFLNINIFFNLCAIATICDVMPINNLNKFFIQEGLKTINNRIGLKHLIQSSKIKEITEKEIAFSIGPKINAAGRIDDPMISYNLLLSQKENEALNLINKLEKINNSRKEMQKNILEEAIILANEQKNNNLIFIYSTNWNLGIIGIIAAKIQEEFNKPCFVGFLHENIIKASGRSNSINLGKILEKALEEQIIISGGGHAQAAGLSIYVEKLNNLHELINKEMNNILKIEEEKTINAIISIKDLTNDFKILSPFGNNNAEPIVLLENLIIQKITDKSYLMITLLQNLENLTLFVFNSKLINQLKTIHKSEQKFSCILKLNLNNFHELIDLII